MIVVITGVGSSGAVATVANVTQLHLQKLTELKGSGDG